uniref:Uncharacterized protein n=1 Tax=Panagrellus redivivus TaxID=6233 RepID=A0A7E4ZR70_PANRE
MCDHKYAPIHSPKWLRPEAVVGKERLYFWDQGVGWDDREGHAMPPPTISCLCAGAHAGRRQSYGKHKILICLPEQRCPPFPRCLSGMLHWCVFQSKSGGCCLVRSSLCRYRMNGPFIVYHVFTCKFSCKR